MLRILLALSSLILLVPVSPTTAQETAQEGERAAELEELRELFRESDDKWMRQGAAARLWLEGDRDRGYLDYLLANAWTAVLDDAPRVWKTDQEGKLVRGEMSEEFLRWSEERGIDPRTAAGKRLREMPTDVAVLANIDDPAAIEVLERGLEASNPIVVLVAARCLAQMGVATALPRLKEIVHTTTEPDLASGVALELLRFDDPEAQAIAESVVDDPELLESKREQIRFERESHSEQ